MENFWKTSEIAVVKELAALGMSARAIAEKLPGRTRNAVIGLWSRQELTRNRSQARNTITLGTAPFVRRKPTRHNSAAVAINARIHRIDRPLPPTTSQDEPTPLKISILDIGPLQCRKVVDDETDDNCLAVYCGHPITVDPCGEPSSWCAYHYFRFKTPRR